MERNKIYCEECVEDIPNDEVYWDEARLYCGRCGSELDTTLMDSDVFTAITSGRPEVAFLKNDEGFYDDDDDDQEDEGAGDDYEDEEDEEQVE